MKYCYLFLILTLFSCGEKSGSDQSNDSSKAINDTISEIRNVVSPKAVASYSEPVADKDKLNNWKFAVELFETPQRFKYLVKIEYMALNESDTITLPNFGMQPKPELRKGKDETSCIIGFLDKEGVFREYKLVAVKDKQLKISTLKQYARTRYRVK